MVVEVYGVHSSPPCRAVYLTCEALGVAYNLKMVDLLKGEHKKPEFLKMNPQHTVPTMKDGDVVVVESHAIMGYVANKYAPTSDIYPKDPAARALVESRLYFASGLFSVMRSYLYATTDEQKEAFKEKITETLQILETFLTRSAYVAGDHLTLADLSLLAMVSTTEVVGWDFSPYAKMRAWLAKLKKLPYYSVNEKGLQVVEEMRKKRAAEAAGKK